jgi:DNA mismatch repair protein MLH1
VAGWGRWGELGRGAVSAAIALQKDDLAIVCERFTTSKLKEFRDLETIATYGFRGEALASITHVAHVSITSMTKDSPFALKAHYRDGHLASPAPGGSSDPVPCAGMPGTVITVEDMFYNMPTRLKSFRSAHEEYNRIVDVVTKYAVHYGDKGVSFSCRKQSAGAADVHAPASSDRRSVVGQLYGAALSKELVDVRGDDLSTEGEDPVVFSYHGLMSNPNFSLKRGVFMLFVNGR